MTAVRRSVLVAKESTFGGGLPSGGSWYRMPPGAYITFTASRQAQSYYETGSKKRALTSWGQIAVQWTLTYLQDYNYLEMLALFFDEVSDATAVSGATGSYKHVFKKTNGKMPKSFTFRVKQLDRMVNDGSGYNEVTQLVGCVCKTLNTSASSNGSQINVSISGYAIVPVTTKDQIDATDWSAFTSAAPMEPIQYSCVFLDSMDDNGLIGEVDQVACSWDNGIGMVYNMCTPKATKYYEGQNNYSFNVSCYDNNMFKLKLRPNTGGGDAYDSDDTDFSWKMKGLKNCDDVYIASYSGTSVSSISTSEYQFIIHPTGATMKSMTWQKGDGQKLQQSLSSVECDDMEIEVVNKSSANDVWLSGHQVTPATSNSS